MTGGSAAFVLILIFLSCAAARQAARRKGRTPAWGFAALVFPPALLLLELLPTHHSQPPIVSNLVLEWVASLVVLAGVVVVFAVWI